MRIASRMTKAQATDKIFQNAMQFINGDVPPQIALENNILEMIGGMETISKEKLADVLNTIQEIKTTGKLTAELKKIVRTEALEEMTEDAIKVITGGKNLPKDFAFTTEKEYERGRSWQENISVTLRGMGKTLVGYNDILDMLSSLDKTSTPGQSQLNKIGAVLDEINAERKGLKEQKAKVRDMAAKIFNFKNDGAMIDHFNRDLKIESLGKFKLLNGETIDLKVSKSEARKLYMEFKDNSLDASFETMGYTNEIKKAIINYLSEQDIEFANAQMKYYKEYYKSINEVYKNIYGINLPAVENYSPIKREGIGKEEIEGNEFLKEVVQQRSVAPGSVKARTLNTHKISRQNDFAVLEQHITEMEHFKAWAEKVRDLKAIYGNPKFMAAVSINHDRRLITLLNGYVTKLIGGNDSGVQLWFIDKLRMHVVKSVLPLKLTIGLKQLSSAPAYMETIPVLSWARGVGEFFMNPIGAIKEMYSLSTLLQTRAQNIERDMSQIAKSQKYNSFRKGADLENLSMINMYLGDKGSIYAGGYAVYKHWLRKGLTPQEAIKKFEEVTTSTQQSGDITEQSYWQNKDSWAKLMTTFLSQPNQYFRRELNAARGLITGRGSKLQHVKALALYHIVLPTIFQFVSDGFRWDDDEQKRARIMGSLNGIFMIGDGIDGIVRALLKMKQYPDSNMALSLFTKMQALIQLHNKKKKAKTDQEKKFRLTAEILGLFTGKPLKTLFDMERGIEKIIEGKVEEGIKQVAGYSPFTAEGGKEKTPSKIKSR